MLEHLLYCLLSISFSSGESLPLSSGNQITVKFTTVGPETAKGFHFVYQGQTLSVNCCWVLLMYLLSKLIYKWLQQFCS